MLKRLSNRPMLGRDPNEAHRAATTLELFFDLVYVVAVASAASGLHDYLHNGQYGAGFFAYLTAFFAIWLSWFNYSWFASAYDTDDFRFRLYTYIQIFGALIFAVGLKSFFQPEASFALAVLGYVVMRLALVMQWLRAAREDKTRRQICLRYAGGIAFMQCLWVLWLFLPLQWQRPVMPLLMIGELLVPIFASRTGETPWHPHHIAERYALLTIIVLGEGVLASMQAINKISPEGFNHWNEWFLPLGLGLGASALIFLLWWSYFKLNWGDRLVSRRHDAYIFGYAHYLIFATLACVGVGIGLIADACIEANQAYATSAILVTSGAVAVYLLTMNAFRVGVFGQGRSPWQSFVGIILTSSLAAVAVALGLPIEYSLFVIALSPLYYILL